MLYYICNQKEITKSKFKKKKEVFEMKVVNKNGYELDFDAAVILMNDEIREALNDKIAPCTEQEFFTAYEEAHEKATGEEWFLSGSNPTW